MSPITQSPSKQVRFTQSPPISAANAGVTSSSTPFPAVPSENYSSSTVVLPHYPLLAGPLSPIQESPLLAEDEQVTQAAGVPAEPSVITEPPPIGSCDLSVHKLLTLEGYVCLELLKVEAQIAFIRDMLARQ